MRSRTDEIGDEPSRGVLVIFPLEHSKVGHRRNRCNRLEQLRLDDGRLQGGIASVGPADDGDPARVGDALASQPFGRSGDVAD